MRPGFIITLLIAVVVGLQLVSLFAVTQATRANDSEQLTLSSVHSLESHTKNLTNQLQQFLTPIDSQLVMSRQLALDGLMNTQDNRTLELFFLSQLRSNPSMNAMYLGRFDGSFVAVVRFDRSLVQTYQNEVLRAKVVAMNNGTRNIEWREYSLDGKLLDQWSDNADSFDPRMLDWYKSARDHDKPVWTNTFSLTESNNLAIAASVTLKNMQHKEVGVLGVSVELSELNNVVANLPVSATTTTIVLDSQLNKIALATPYGTSAVANSTALIQQSLTSVDPDSSTVDKHWFSDNEQLVTLQRQIHLFDGALQWRVLAQSAVQAQGELSTDHRSTLLYTIIAVIVFPGLIAILCIFGLGERLQRLYRRATVDYLTKAYNREEFIGRFSKRLIKGRSNGHNNISVNGRQPERWVAVLLDLDGFKQINDHYGHDAGDAILTTVVCRLQHIVGRAGFVGRLGGDEFAVALRLKPKVDASHVVEQIRRRVVEKPIVSARAQHQVGMTAGVAIADSRESVEQLLERADRALVAGKAVSKNTTYGASRQAEKDRAAQSVILGHEPIQSNNIVPVGNSRGFSRQERRRRVA